MGGTILVKVHIANAINRYTEIKKPYFKFFMGIKP